MSEQAGNHEDNRNQEWMQLQKDWQSFQPDINKINKKISWVTWRMISILVLDVITILAYIPFLIVWVVPAETSLIYKLWPYLMLPIGIYGVYLDFKLRIPLFKLEKGSSKDILSAYLKFVRTGVLVGLWGGRFSLGLLAWFIFWALAVHFLDPENAKRLSIILLAGVTSVLVLTSLAMYWYKAKKAKEAQNILALWREYLE
jgi:hypothetical protein